jgi:hypothetical protein
MKTFKKVLLSAVVGVGLVFGAMHARVKAADISPLVPGQPQQIVNSEDLANTNLLILVSTNTSYPRSISNGGFIINYKKLTLGDARTLSVQFSTQGGTAAADPTNVAILVLRAATWPMSLTNSAGQSGYTNINPDFVWSTNRLALNGANWVTTNIVFSPSSTPAFGPFGDVAVYGIGCSSGCVLSNYHVYYRAQ